MRVGGCPVVVTQWQSTGWNCAEGREDHQMGGNYVNSLQSTPPLNIYATQKKTLTLTANTWPLHTFPLQVKDQGKPWHA